MESLNPLLLIYSFCVHCHYSVNTAHVHVWKVMNVHVAMSPQTHESGWLCVCFPLRVYEQRKPKQTVSADNGQRMTVNLLIHESLQSWNVLICCAHISACEQTFILRFLSPTPSLPVSTDLSLSSSPARTAASMFSHSASDRFAQVTRGFATTRDLHRHPVPSVSADHAYIHHTLDICVLLSFNFAVVECVAICAHTWT